MRHEFAIARQPIYDRGLGLYGYELLYRGRREDGAFVDDSDLATGDVLIRSFVDLGLKSLVGEGRAFINLTRRFFTGEQPVPLAPDQVVLEVLEDVPPDAEVVAGVRALAGQGYEIALDDFRYAPQYDPLLRLAHYVKLDIMAIGTRELPAEVERLRRFGCRLLAEKVETREEFELCKGLGFEYFQGYFFAKPDLVRGRALQSARHGLVRLLARLQDPQTEVEELEQLIMRDVALSYRLLRYVNNPYVGLSRRIDSIRQAILLLGLDQVRKLATLLLFSVHAEDSPPGLIALALARGRFCESLAPTRPEAGPNFTVGLFSLLDAILDLPMEALLAELPLNEAAKAAILHGWGPSGAALRAVTAYEQGDWTAIPPPYAADPGLDELYRGALSWARQVLAQSGPVGGEGRAPAARVQALGKPAG